MLLLQATDWSVMWLTSCWMSSAKVTSASPDTCAGFALWCTAARMDNATA